MTWDGENVSFTPQGDWNYVSGERIRFVGNREFIIQFIPASPGAPLSPFRDDRNQAQFRGVGRAGTLFATSPLVVRGGRQTDPPDPAIPSENEEIEPLIALNDNAKLPTGEKLVAHYRHVIVAVDAQGRPELTINKLGSWGC